MRARTIGSATITVRGRSVPTVRCVITMSKASRVPYVPCCAFNDPRLTSNMSGKVERDGSLLVRRRNVLTVSIALRGAL